VKQDGCGIAFVNDLHAHRAIACSQ